MSTKRTGTTASTDHTEDPAYTGHPGADGGRRLRPRSPRPRVRAAGTVALLLVPALTATACGSDSKPPAASEKRSKAAGSTIALSVSTLENPFFTALHQGAEKEAKKHSVKLEVRDAGDKAEAQSAQLDKFTDGGISSVIVNPVDAAAAGKAVKSLRTASIPVIAADRTVKGADVDALVASDNAEGGWLAGDAISDELSEKGKVVVLQGPKGASVSRERSEGFTDSLKKHPGIEVVAKKRADFDKKKGEKALRDLLQENPDVDGVFAENDEMALGAVEALESVGNTDVTVIGFDGTEDARSAVKDGSLSATIAQDPEEIGKLAVRNAVRLVEKEQIERSLRVPLRVVDKDALS